MSSMRDDLSAALDSNAEEDDTQNYEETPQEVDSVDEGIADEETETDAEESNTDNDANDAAPAPDSEKSEGSGSELAATEPASTDSIKAPVNWGPKEREDWSKIPRHLQEKVMARETEISNMLNTTADARRTHDEFSQMSERYSHTLSDVAGNTPMERANNIFGTVDMLNRGSSQQKASLVADLIHQYGVDIGQLDSAIVGSQPTEQQSQNSQLERMLQERMAPFEQQMGQQRAYEQQQHQQKQEQANNEVVEFSQNAEFLSDVRYDMADLIDMADKQGRPISMQKAYEAACSLHPQIQAVLDQRKQQQQLAGGTNAMALKRAAASSITGSRGGAGGGGGSQSMRDALVDAWDGQGKI